MFVSKLATLTTAFVLAATTTLSAQALRNADEPAEFPPSSFSGNQYVDSKGCVYIRAGISGNTTWVPRVNRQRNVICGFQPSIARAKPAAEPKTRVAAAPKKPAAAPKPRVASAPKAVAKPAPKRIVRAQPKPAARATQPLRTTAALAPRPTQKVVRQPAAPAAAAAPRQVQRQASGGCAGASALSSKYINRSSSNLPVRCGPQTESPRTIVGKAGSRSVVTAAPQQQARVVRQAQQPVRRTTGTVRYTPNSPERRVVIAPPKGYKPVWDDDRLNPLRGAETLQGRAQTNLVWTQEVPRRLIERSSGRDVTAANPNLVYPYTDLTSQIRAGVQPTQRPAVVTKKVRTVKAKTVKSRVSTKTVTPRAKVLQAPRAERKVVAPKRPAATSASHRYVQVGTFGVPSNAQKAARRLQSAGLPARIGQYSKGGKTYQIVMAGPFANQSNLNSALKAARRAGFSDAFFRK